MSKSAKAFHGVEFAKRYGSPVGGWFSAATALRRLDNLIVDARSMDDLKSKDFPGIFRLNAEIFAEIVTYYSVGYVTCMEWHARSRIRDLLTYKPSAAGPEDIRQIKDNVLREMLSANTTVPDIVGATTTIASLDDYIGVFSRIFKELDINESPFEAIKGVYRETGEPWVSGADIELLQQLHPLRHRLVHEIGMGSMGHQHMREAWSPKEAIRYGEVVMNVMRLLEQKLTEKAPLSFPNLIGTDGLPISQYQVLLAEISKMEATIEEYVAVLDTGSKAADAWPVAKRLSRDHLMAEIQFINSSDMFFYKYADLRTPLKNAAVKARHDYLRSILDIFGTAWEPEMLIAAIEAAADPER